MFSNVYLILILCFVNVYGESRGDSCKVNNKSGTCLLLNDCEEALKNIRENKPIERCGFDGITPIVCCPKKEDLRSITVKKCIEYYAPIKPIRKFPIFGIIGGVEANVKEFPHMVALGFDSEDGVQWLCGGALISTNYVLTAAHCLFSQQYGEVKRALLGTINLRNHSIGGISQMFDIKNIIRHPDYKRSQKYHDVGLLELNGTVEVNSFVKPICLNANFEIPNVELTAIGWGKTDLNGNPSNELMKVNLISFNNSYCKEQYADASNLPEGIVDQHQLCAGGNGTDEPKDTCQGDSGGPLHYVQGTFPFLVGITSFGRACGLVYTPGVYARVSYYLPWIENIIWK